MLEIAGEAEKNQGLEYHAYFKDKNGEAILDSGFYQSFSWKLDVMAPDGTGQAMVESIEAEVSGGVLKGGISFHGDAYRQPWKLYAESGNQCGQFCAIRQYPGGKLYDIGRGTPPVFE